MHPALVLIDLQRDYLDRGGLVPAEADLIAGITKLLSTCREHSIPIFHVITRVNPDGSNRMPHWIEKDHWACVDGTVGAQPPPELAPLQAEQVFSKPYFSIFGSAEFVAALRDGSIDTLILSGIYTHACIRASALDAYSNGYTVWIAADAVASTEPDHALLSLKYIDGRAGEVLNVAQIVDRLAPSSPSLVTPTSNSPQIWRHRNPSRSEEVLSEVPLARTFEVAEATRHTEKFAEVARRSSKSSRHDCLSRWIDSLFVHKNRLIDLLVKEVGKPVRDARAEFEFGILLLRHAVAMLCDDAPDSHSGFELRRYPVGVVGLITPWNNPFAIPVGKIAPACAFGNAIVWKPALQAFQISALIMESLRESGLGEHIRMITGDAQTGRLMVMQTGINAISFTGSVDAGHRVAAGCAVARKSLQAELGGNNAVLVMADVDPDQAARQLAPWIFSFAGQRCTAPRRIIVEELIRTPFERALVEATLALQLGEPHDESTQIGPVISHAQQTRLSSLTTTGVSAGGRLLCGGRIPTGFSHGYWFEPTLIADPDPDCSLVQDESFGPIAVLLAARNFEAAMALCNRVRYGLVATLFSDRHDVQQRFIKEVQAGIVSINQAPLSIAPQAPFGGWLDSGIGLPEHGQWDREFYTKPQAVYGISRTAG